MSSANDDGKSPSGEASPQIQSSDPSSREKPVKVGEEIDVTVSELSRRGEGVARIQGFVIFVPNTRQGQQAKIRIKEIKPNFATAEVIETGSTA